MTSCAVCLSAAITPVQGFPNFSPPPFLIDALTEAARQPLLNQYTRGHGHPRLVKALAKMYGQLQGREINPMTEVHRCSNIVCLGVFGAHISLARIASPNISIFFVLYTSFLLFHSLALTSTSIHLLYFHSILC